MADWIGSTFVGEPFSEVLDGPIELWIGKRLVFVRFLLVRFVFVGRFIVGLAVLEGIAESARLEEFGQVLFLLEPIAE